MSDLISRADAIEAMGEEPPIVYDLATEWEEHDMWVRHISALKALPSANLKNWNGLYIKVYADDDPQDKAEKLYQICDSNEALSEVAKCIQSYLDEPSAEAVQGEWKHTITWQPYCSNCEYVFGEDEEFSLFWKYCPMCGTRMKGGENE